MIKRLPVPLQVIGQALRDWWDDWVNMALISLAWLLCWATVVLGPPATFGLYYVTNRLAHGRSLGLRGFIEGGKQYFAKSWLWMLLNLVVAVVLVVNIWFYGQLDADWAAIVQIFPLFLGLAWLVVQFYALPYLMEQKEKSLKLALRNGLLTFLAAPGYTAVVAGVAALLAILSVWLVAPLFLGSPCLIAALGNRAVRERLETYGVQEREAARKESDEREQADEVASSSR
jgi:uncharacterized membrane protein YesL